MINKKIYKDIGKVYKNCFSDNVEICQLFYFDGFY